MSQPNEGNSGKGYDVTSSGNNSQVAKVCKFEHGSMVLIIGERREITTALETTLPAVLSQPMATPITTLTTTVSESSATMNSVLQVGFLRLTPATRKLLLQQPQRLHVLQRRQWGIQVYSVRKVATWTLVAAGKGKSRARSDL